MFFETFFSNVEINIKLLDVSSLSGLKQTFTVVFLYCCIQVKIQKKKKKIKKNKLKT
jgi:hypothetical protein